MMTVTAVDVINNTLPESGSGLLCIYVSSYKDFLLYVGKAEQNIIDRLEDHLGLSFHAESQMGRLVEDNLPDSLDWRIDLLTLHDCQPIVTKYFSSAGFVDLLNANPDAHSLPSKYTQRKESRMRDAHTKVFDDNK